jgi:hypothetical protein
MVSGTSHRKDLRNVMLTIVGSPLNPAGSTRLLYSISDHKYEQSIGRSNEMQTKRVLLMLSLWLVLATAPSLAQNESSDIVDLLQSGKYKEAEAFYRPLLSVDTTGDNYAGLAVALAMQGEKDKIAEAQRILAQAGKKRFSSNPKVLAAGGYVSFAFAKIVDSCVKYELYKEASSHFCKRALKADPNNKIALETLRLIEFESIHPRQFKEIEDLNSIDLEFIGIASGAPCAIGPASEKPKSAELDLFSDSSGICGLSIPPAKTIASKIASKAFHRIYCLRSKSDRFITQQ